MQNACGILTCYNEEHIIAECLSHYLQQGIDIVFADNQSTDSSLAIAGKFRQENAAKARIIDILHLETQGFEWQKILRSLCSYMHARLSGYKWIVLIDSDSFYYSPVKGLSLLEFMDYADHAGYNIMNGELHEFYPTEKDDPLIGSPLERLRYCRPYARPFYPQHKIFRYHPTVDFYTHSAHICLRDGPRVSPVKFIFNHYPWVSYEHALRKIFKDRNPRLVERSISPEAHPQYLGLLPVREELVRESRTLQIYGRDKLSITKIRLYWLTRLGFLCRIAEAAKASLGNSLFLLAKSREASGVFMLLLRFNKHWIMRYFKELFVDAREKLIKFNDYSHPPHRRITIREIVRQKDVVYGLPENFHFLMTNFCNAHCAFCNQLPAGKEKKEMKFQDFLAILSHIPQAKREFYFSGGGEPLLCEGLLKMIEHVNATYPATAVNIITNGLLIAQYAGDLSKLNIDKLIISVHGGSKESNNAMLQVGGYDVFDNLELLNACLRKNKKCMGKVFSCTVSRLNIDEVPLIIKKAAALDVKKVKVLFSRFYQESGTGKGEFDGKNSLFFDKKRYNEVILNSKRLARRLGVTLEHDPLFFGAFVERPCFQPWQNIIIDWNGDTYPCTGGERWFYRQVRSGAYYFGNLLQENLAQCWNNSAHVMTRRTCSRRYKRKWIPECRDCHNSLCLRGPDIECGHIMRDHEIGNEKLQP